MVVLSFWVPIAVVVVAVVDVDDDDAFALLRLNALDDKDE